VNVVGNTLSVGKVVIDGAALPVGASAAWDSDSEGYFFQLFFELWRYDVASHNFKFDNRFVGLWLNMTIGQNDTNLF
jgi:hypothetical protein